MRLYTSMAAFAALACLSADVGGSGGAAAEAAPSAAPPDEPKPAPKKAKSTHIVWCAPGYESFGIGRVYKGPADVAARLQAVGKARPASDAEIEAAGENVGTFG